MRLFAMDIRDIPEEERDRSALVRELLAYAFRELWGLPCPEIGKRDDGKPYFRDTEGKYLSLSHTDTHVLAALSEYELGVDIQSFRNKGNGPERRLFSENMLRCFGYYRAWALRESVFKLCGRGSLRTMEFSLEDGEILSPFEGLRCRLYDDVEGCAVAAACREGEFPDSVEIVALRIIRP